MLKVIYKLLVKNNLKVVELVSLRLGSAVKTVKVKNKLLKSLALAKSNVITVEIVSESFGQTVRSKIDRSNGYLKWLKSLAKSDGNTTEILVKSKG